MKLTNVDEWLDSGGYLPEVLRDFHDQKDIFKAIHQTTLVEAHHYANKIDFVAGQCYAIDIFLWWMARRGYVLQRTHRRGNFCNLEADVHKQKEIRNALLASTAFYGKAKSPDEPTEAIAPTENPQST